MFASRNHRVHVAEDSELRSSRPQLNAQLPYKTPVKSNTGKSVGFGTVTRTNLKENATNYHPPRTTGKSNAFPMTPGLKRSQTLVHQNTLNAAQKVQQPTSTKISRLLNLTNKTPYPSRFRPGSIGEASSPIKLPTLLSADESTPGPSQTIIPPSRSRQSVRLPRLSDQSESFRTPAPQDRRRHWEYVVGSEDISVEVTSPSGDVSQAIAPVEIESDDEVEYMPPPVEPLPYDPGFDLPDFKALGESLWKIGTVTQFDAFDYVKPVQPPFKLEKSDLEEIDELLSRYLIPEHDDSAVTLAQLSSYPIAEPAHNPSTVKPRTKQATQPYIPAPSRAKPITHQDSHTISRAAKPSGTRKPPTSLSSGVDPTSRLTTRSMTVPTRSTKSVIVPQPTRVTRAMTRAASTTQVDSSKVIRGETGRVQLRPRVEKAVLGQTRSKIQTRGSPGLKDVVADLMQPQAQIWDDNVSIRLLD